MRQQIRGSSLSSILSIGEKLALTVGKTLGMSALVGLASERGR